MVHSSLTELCVSFSMIKLYDLWSHSYRCESESIWNACRENVQVRVSDRKLKLRGIYSWRCNIQDKHKRKENNLLCVRGVHKLIADGEYTVDHLGSVSILITHSLTETGSRWVAICLDRFIDLHYLSVLLFFSLASCFVVGCWKGTASSGKWEKKKLAICSIWLPPCESFIQEWVEPLTQIHHRSMNHINTQN